MDLIDRYLGAVARQLPIPSRDEITRELRANLLDNLEQIADDLGRPLTNADIAIMLRNQGHPTQVAASFQPPQTLVNSTWFPLFKQAVYYGIILMFLAKLIGFGIVTLTSGKMPFGDFVTGFVHFSLAMFAAVTGVFYLLSNLPQTRNISPYRYWNPEHLPPVQRPWQQIKMLDQLSELASGVFFVLILQYSMWASPAAISQLKISFTPAILPWVNALTWVVIASLFMNLWNLAYPYWTRQKLTAALAINLCGAVIALWAMREPEMIKIAENAVNPLLQSILIKVNEWTLVGITAWYLYAAGLSAYRCYTMAKP